MDIFGNFSKLIMDKRKRRVVREEELDYVYSDVTLEGIGKVEDREQVRSIFAVKAVVILIFLCLFLRLFTLQVVEGQSNQKLAEGNRIRPRVLEAVRGVITDKDGVWLARNRPDFVLGLYPSDLPKKKSEREEIYKKLADLSKIDADEIKKEAEQNGLMSLDMVSLRENIPHDDALILEKKIAGIPGVSIAKKSSRQYAALPGLAHILGYTGKISPEDLLKNPDYFLSDRVGKTGLESQYENELRGKHGVEQVEVDSKGSIVRILVQDGHREAVPGNELTLYLDRGLQEKTAAAIKTGMDEGKKATGEEVSAGVAIVMDVRSGGILSMVSLPDYDNNLFATKISAEDYKKLIEDKGNPLFNRAIKGTYPPGSIIKIVMASAGLAEHVIDPNTAFVTPAQIRIGDFVFPDWKDHSYESTDVRRAIAESNNIFFYAIGGGYDKIRGLGIERMKKYWQLFGLGAKTGVDLPGEASGFLPDTEWKKQTKGEPWYIGDTYHAAIGQGDLLITPLQMLRVTASIANGGKLLHPQLVKKVVSHEGDVISEFGPRIEKENFISSSIIKTIQEGMRMTVTEGSARNLSDLPVSVAGKTGTAQFLNNQKTHAWFEAYAPYEDPQIAVIVVVEGGGGGHEIAAPVAREILNYFFTR